MNKIVKNTAILAAITVVAGCLLGLVYDITKAPIAQAQEDAKQEAYRTVLADAAEFTVDDSFDASSAVTVLTGAGYTGDDITEVATAVDASGETMGWCVAVRLCFR